MIPKASRLSRLFREAQFNTLFGPQTLPRLIINTFKAALFVHLFTEYIGELRTTWGPSMLPTLGATGDWVYISRLSRRGKDVCVGDMVAVKHPMFPGTGAIKRVVGLPGDFVLRDTPGSPSDVMIQVRDPLDQHRTQTDCPCLRYQKATAGSLGIMCPGRETLGRMGLCHWL